MKGGIAFRGMYIFYLSYTTQPTTINNIVNKKLKSLGGRN